MALEKLKNFFEKSVDKEKEKIYYHLARRRKARRGADPNR